MKPWMRTRSGRVVNPLALRPEDVYWPDVAHHLANLNRFTGAPRVPINIAQHSYWVSKLAERFAPADQKRLAALQGLLHDGSEYVLNDVNRWLKREPEMAGYREAEARAQQVIYEVAGCPLEDLPSVKQADDFMARVEGQFAWGPNWNDVPGYGPLTTEELMLVSCWEPWPWEQSRDAFLSRLGSSGMAALA